MTKINYRKRVPSSLIEILNRKEITKICSKSEALKIDSLLDKAATIMEMDFDPKQKYDLVFDIVEPYISKAGKKRFLKEMTYFDAVELYLETNKKQISKYEYECKKYFFLDLCGPILSYLIDKKLYLKEIQAVHLNRLKWIISNLPSRNKKQYRSMPIDELVRNVDRKELNISDEDKLSITTINKHLKRLTSLSNFGKDSGVFDLVQCNLLVKAKSKNLRQNRDALSVDEIRKLLELNDDQEVTLLILLSFYSGLRLSEIPKCKIIRSEIPYFDLTSTKVSLKTNSSHRKVPVHISLFPYLDEIENWEYNHLLWLARKTKKRISRVLQSCENKSLYSLRHSFATELISKNINPAVVSELMGHSQKSLTLSIYTKQFPLDTLNKAIQLLTLE